MRFKTLKSDAELGEYRRLFLEGLKRNSAGFDGDLPLEYLRSTHVVAAFDSKKRMIAGYVLGTAHPLRLLSFVPSSAHADLKVPFGCTWDDCCEVTCAWKLPEISSVWMSYRLWPRVHLSVLFSSKKLLLGHDQAERLDKFYGTTGPITIYSGLSTYGLQSRLFAYDWKRIVLCIVGLFIYETPRRFIVQTLRRISK